MQYLSNLTKYFLILFVQRVNCICVSVQVFIKLLHIFIRAYELMAGKDRVRKELHCALARSLLYLLRQARMRKCLNVARNFRVDVYKL